MKENFAKCGDIFKASIFGSDVYVVSKPEYCERILRTNWRNYVRSGQVVKRIAFLVGNGLIASNGEFWANQRRMIQPAFSKDAVRRFVTAITSANALLLEKWKLAAYRQETVNVTQDVSLMVLRITLTAIFGEDYTIVAPHFKILAEESARNLQFAQSFRPLSHLILDIAEQRRCRPKADTDIVGIMMGARDRHTGKAMSDSQLAKEVMTLIVAGHETTAGLLNWIWYLLSRHPEAQTRLQEEFRKMPWEEVPSIDMLPKYTYTEHVIEEALRLYPPLWLMTRRAVSDDQLGSFFVPAGTEIYISPYLIQRDPNLWGSPDRFDPGRTNLGGNRNRKELAMCPFGAGPRNCIGEFFARVETQMHVMMFAKELRLKYNKNEIPEVTTGMNLLSKEDFIMQPEVCALNERIRQKWSVSDTPQGYRI
jgi:cytochrome P450